jgi:3-deoxy-manno-octulosonate cytidylyltransferase (CMP-KDO synthetase)
VRGRGFFLSAPSIPEEMPSVVAIVPARLASTRLPEKALAEIAGRPMVCHVWARARAAAGIDRVLVATDDARVAAAVRAAGGEAALTGAHATGTDRVAAVAAGLAADVIVNVQGDLPLLDPAALAACIAALHARPDAGMASLMTPIRERADHESPHVVKVVTAGDGCALYFSRSPLPYWRGPRDGAPLGRRHIGVYAYRRDVLLALAGAPRSPLERAEELEQLRALERGVRIRMVEVDSAPPEVDTAEDLARVRRLVEGAR